MSGSIGSLGSLALSLFPASTSGTASALLSAIYGGGGASNADPTVALKSAEANSTQDIAQTAAQPAVARDIAAFRAAVASATSPAQLLQNPTVLKVLLTANGLSGQEQYPALAQKALLSDTTKSTALADQLPNPAWKSTTSLYDFANKGLAVLQKPGVIDILASGYAEVTWRNSLDATTPGLSEALSFRSTASTFTSAVQILGDATARTVVTTALGIPQQIAFQDLGAQEQAITSQLDVSKLQDPKFVEQLTTQYLLAAGAAASSSGSSTPSLDSLAASARGLLA